MRRSAQSINQAREERTLEERIDATNRPLGRIARLDEKQIRTLWPNEERDLSPWVSDNIDLLNEALGLQIEVEEAEARVGNFRLDLAGVETTTQRPVVIENQFGSTDHDHLGKLITYAAGREAGVLVWLAMQFQEAHEAALQWLNDITGPEMAFYGVRLEVLTIDNSNPAPMYTVEVSPPRSKLPPVQQPSERGVRYRDFWAQFIDRLRTNYPGMTRAKTPGAQSWFSTGVGISGFSVGAAFTGSGYFRVELYIDTGNKEQNKRVFGELKESEASIHEGIAEPLDWTELPERRASRISLLQPGTIDDTPEDLRNYVTWGTDGMAKFRDVFRPLLANLSLS